MRTILRSIVIEIPMLFSSGLVSYVAGRIDYR